jgi:hypothetical protein
MKWPIVVLVALTGLIGGCASDVDPTAGPTDPVNTDPKTPTATEPAVSVHVGVVDKGAGDLVPAPATEANTRPRKRMNVEQLDRSIRLVTGGIGWDINETNQFERLAATLGRPDFRQTVQEDLTPSPVFQKFLDDASRAVCTQLVEVDLGRPEDERTLLVHVSAEDTMDSAPDAVEANLRRLLLKYHGVMVAEGAPELERWRWLFKSVVHLTQDPMQAWRSVCIALINHPDFYSF